MGAKFSWFPKFTDTVAKAPEGLRGALLWALVEYGTYGTEPELEWPLNALFESMREDIDNSKRAVENGKSGGRGKRKGAQDGMKPPFADAETPLFDTGNPSLPDAENAETTLSGSPNGGSGNGEPIPYQSIPCHTNPKGGVRRARFAKPSVGEVREYAERYAGDKGLDLSTCDFTPERFVNHYESNGWKVGRNPMKDWKAAVRNWLSDAKPKGGGRDEYSDL